MANLVLLISKVIGYSFMYSCLAVTSNNSFKGKQSDLKVYPLIMSDCKVFVLFSQFYKNIFFSALSISTMNVIIMFLLTGNTKCFKYHRS